MVGHPIRFQLVLAGKIVPDQVLDPVPGQKPGGGGGLDPGNADKMDPFPLEFPKSGRDSRFPLSEGSIQWGSDLQRVGSRWRNAVVLGREKAEWYHTKIRGIMFRSRRYYTLAKNRSENNIIGYSTEPIITRKGRQMTSCVECGHTLSVSETDLYVGELIQCANCGVDLEVVSTDPFEVELFEEEEK
jgi:alpha-aminoadipate carrier protein LysW